MADDVIDFEGISLFIDDTSISSNGLNGKNDGIQRFYVGQYISLKLVLPLTAAGQKKLKTSHPEKSPFAQNLQLAFMRQLSSTVEVNYSFRPFAESSFSKQHDGSSQWIPCNLVSSLHEGLCSFEEMKDQPFLSKDQSSYHIPLQVRVPDVESQCSTIQLEVQTRSVSRHTPCWLSSPTRSEATSLYQQQETIGLNKGKTVTLPLRIIHPPQLKFQQKKVAGKHMIFLQIKNMSAHYCIKIEECIILPEACLKANKTTTTMDCKTQQALLKNLRCGQHANMVKMISGATEMFDNLSPSECYTLCYMLNTADGIDNLAKEELCLEVHIKWSIPYQQYGDHSSVLTTYRLPAMKVKQAPFVMCASPEELNVKKGECFTVLYNITNRLQDFLSITLNWNPNKSEESDCKRSDWRSFHDGLVCQDPCIELGPCSYGSSLQAKVRFQAISPGVYEVCKHMKINLRYLIPSSETVSLGSPCSQTSAEDLWRSRSGSGSSFIESRTWNYPEIENKFSMAFKSYSSGELGSDGFEFDTKYKVQGEDRSLFQKLEVPHSSKYEQLLLSHGNFLKTSCQIYVC